MRAALAGALEAAVRLVAFHAFVREQSLRCDCCTIYLLLIVSQTHCTPEQLINPAVTASQ